MPKISERVKQYVALRRQYPELNDSRLAEIMGVTRERVRQIRNTVGLDKLSVVKRQAIMDYLRQGSYGFDYETATEFGVSTWHVWQIRNELGLPKRSRKGEKGEKRLKIEAYLLAGDYGSDYETARLFGTSFSWIARIRGDLGLPPSMPRVDRLSIERELRTTEDSDTDIALRTNTTVATVGRIRHELGIPARWGRWGWRKTPKI